MLWKLTRHKRASVLVLFGCVYALTGWVQQDTAPQFKASPMARLSYRAQTDVMPLEAWGWVFVAVGIAGIAFALLGPWPQWAGFGVLQGLSLFWGSLFIASWWETGYSRAGIGALTWLLVSGVLFIVADWEDPPGGGT